MGWRVIASCILEKARQIEEKWLGLAGPIFRFYLRNHLKKNVTIYIYHVKKESAYFC